MGSHFIAILFAALLVTAASWTAAAEPPSLARFVPEDVTYYEGFRRTSASDQILEPYREAIRELIRSGIAKDLFELATSDLSPEQRDEARAVARKVLGILRTPSWKELLKEQCSLSFRLAGPMPEILVLFAVAPESGPARLAEFQKAFAALAEMASDILQTGAGSVEGAETTRLDVKGTPFALSVAAAKGLVAISTSEMMLRSSLALAGSGDGKGSLAASARYSKAFEGLAPAEEARLFFDLSGYFSLIRGYLGMAKAGAGNNPEASGWISVADTILDELGRLGPASAVGRVRGLTTSLDGKLSFVQKDGPGFIEKLIRDQVPVDARIVPRDARGFYLTSGVNPARLYDALLDLFRDKVPYGPRALEKWEGIQSRIGFRLREDLLS